MRHEGFLNYISIEETKGYDYAREVNWLIKDNLNNYYEFKKNKEVSNCKDCIYNLKTNGVCEVDYNTFILINEKSKKKITFCLDLCELIKITDKKEILKKELAGKICKLYYTGEEKI